MMLKVQYICKKAIMKKSILITGAGSVIGRAAAIKLSDDGFHIFLVGRTLKNLEETKSLLNGDDHKLISVDVGNKHQLHDAIQKSITKEDNLVGVFANAGVGGANVYGENDRWEEIIQVNVSGPYYTIMECLPFLKASDVEYKNVLITGSCLSRFAVPNYPAYITAKTGVNGLVKALAIDFAASKILFNLGANSHWTDGRNYLRTNGMVYF